MMMLLMLLLVVVRLMVTYCNSCGGACLDSCVIVTEMVLAMFAVMMVMVI